MYKVSARDRYKLQKRVDDCEKITNEFYGCRTQSETLGPRSSSQAPCGTSASATGVAASLVEVGCNAAVSFVFAFLKRAWQSGDEDDGCSDLLGQAFESLRHLPPASLFHLRCSSTPAASSPWLAVVDKCSAFLRSIVLG